MNGIRLPINSNTFIIARQICQNIRHPKRPATSQNHTPGLMIHTHEMHKLRCLRTKRRARERRQKDACEREIGVLGKGMVVGMVQRVDAGGGKGSDAEETHEIPAVGGG
jgi:hypothetical protein